MGTVVLPVDHAQVSATAVLAAVPGATVVTAGMRVTTLAQVQRPVLPALVVAAGEVAKHKFIPVAALGPVVASV